MHETIDNLDYLAARVHGCRSRLVDGPRLEALCRLRTVPQLCCEVFPGQDLDTAVAFQRRLVERLARELGRLTAQSGRSAAELLRWLLVWFRVEDLKLCLRAVLTGVSPATVRPQLMTLAAESNLEALPPGVADAVQAMARFVPAGPLRRSLLREGEHLEERPRPFFIEAALDRAYLTELLLRSGALSGEARELVAPLAAQEADTFHLQMVARGRHVYGLPEDRLRGFHVPGSGISTGRWIAMLMAPTLRTAAGYALGKAVDCLPPEPEGGADKVETLEPALLEVLAWNRRRRLAERAFRRSHMGLAAVVAYVVLRRVEVLNLVALSEGIRLSVDEATVSQRFIPRRSLEVPHA